MKRTVLLVIAATFVLPTRLIAQEMEESETRYYRHEVNFSIGGVRVRSGWSDDYEHSVMGRFGLVVGKAGDGKVIMQIKDGTALRQDCPLMALSYYYHLDHHFAVGGLFGFCRVNDWLGYPNVNRQGEIQKTGYTDVKGTSLFLLPSLKWSWLNNRWCSLYMKASAGIHHQSMYLDSESIPKEQTREFDKKHLNFCYHLTPFGWEIGKQKIRWFMEFGLGSTTNIQTGLTYRFGRF